MTNSLEATDDPVPITELGMPRSRRPLTPLCWLTFRRAVLVVSSAPALTAAACIPIYQHVAVTPTDPRALPAYAFDDPARVYLADGSVAVLREGGVVEGGLLQTSAWRFSLTLADSARVTSIPLDSIIAIEVFRAEAHNVAGTVLLTAVQIPLIALGAAGLAVAIFGSCPTIYADVAGEGTIQMEAFSYSIAPLFEARDMARLSAVPDSEGIVRLELRNEALETHYTNQMELLEVRHAPEESVLPDGSGRPIAFAGPRPPLTAVDRDGRDVLDRVIASDSSAFRSSGQRLASAALDDFKDHVDLVFDVPEGQRELALVLRLRNTLLNSVLFYDVMLGPSGAGAVTWLGSELDGIGSALELGRWYQDRMGMRVLVETEGGFREVEHLADVGPIAWKDLAVAIPAQGLQVRVRLEFVSDSWFIDSASIAGNVSRPGIRRVPVSRVERPDGTADLDAGVSLASSDEDYLVTYPGDRLELEFHVQSAVPTPERTLLLAAQGYYVEWVRGTWLAEARSHSLFEPSDAALLGAMSRWRDVMDEFERDFHATRIPTR